MLNPVRAAILAIALALALPSAATTVPSKGGSASRPRTGNPTGTDQSGNAGNDTSGRNGPDLKGSLGGIPSAPTPHTTTAIDLNSPSSAPDADTRPAEDTDVPPDSGQTADAQADTLLEQYATEADLLEKLPLMEKMRQARE